MKTMTAAVALLFLAGTAQAALAQEQGQGQNHGQGGGRPHGQAPHERPMHPGGESHERAGGRPGGPPGGGQPHGQPGGWRNQPSPPPAAPQARPAPPAQQAPRAEGPRGGHWRGGPPPGQAAGQPGGQGHAFQGRPDHPGDRNGGPERRGDGRRDDHRWAGRDGDHRPDGAWNRGDWNRGDWNRGDWNRGDWRGRQQWRPGAYPHSFHSAHRYRIGPYVRPPHFYNHLWAFGEILPGAWYATDYLIDDWWNYDLPEPPPGLAWVRVGDDALLVDQYNGEIVQVVRELFW